jgi:p-aminobenzoyl-glutamate transporter AbgT
VYPLAGTIPNFDLMNVFDIGFICRPPLTLMIFEQIARHSLLASLASFAGTTSYCYSKKCALYTAMHMLAMEMLLKGAI